jgi:hypothetical protein
MNAQEIAELKSKISTLQIVYFVVFALSLVLIVTRVSTPLWAITLGSGVAIRLYRNSLINKYNQAISKGPVPLI